MATSNRYSGAAPSLRPLTAEASIGVVGAAGGVSSACGADGGSVRGTSRTTTFTLAVPLAKLPRTAWVLWRVDGLSPLSRFIGAHNMIFAERWWCRLLSLQETTFGLAGPLMVCRTTVLSAVVFLCVVHTHHIVLPVASHD